MGFLIVLLVIILVIAFKSIKIVKQAEVYVIERLGKFYKVADAGLTIIIPFFDFNGDCIINFISRKISLNNRSINKDFYRI